MTFISYAQNFEDVILNRIFKNIDNGFYVDVGAWSPDVDSVTSAFYRKGWHGINIEPNKKYFAEFIRSRPRDINICACVGSAEKEVVMYFLRGLGSGMSTIREDIANEHLSKGWDFDKESVSMRPLSSIWKMHVPQNQPVHFLKVDVEGAEKEVLESMDWAGNRPWVVLIEATLPMSQVEAHHEWEHLLIQADYVFAYADGLNRFYISREMAHLSQYFKYPPNVFDEFMSSQLQAALISSEVLKAENKILSDARAELNGLRSELLSANMTIREIFDSWSWRLTSPLRWFASMVRSLLMRLK